MNSASLIMSTLAKVRRAVTEYLTLALLAVSLGVNVYLGLKILKPRGETSVHSMPVGNRVASLAVVDLAGKSLRLGWPSPDKKLTIVYVFTPTCVWCQRNMENFKALGQADSAEYRFVPVSLTRVGLVDYIGKFGLTFPVYAEPTALGGGSFSYSGTPETIAISSDGIVKHVWRGAFTEKVKKDIEVYLGIHLPGMKS